MSATEPSAWARQLRRYREMPPELTQEEVAQGVVKLLPEHEGLAGNAISRYERGALNPSGNKAVALAAYFASLGRIKSPAEAIVWIGMAGSGALTVEQWTHYFEGEESGFTFHLPPRPTPFIGRADLLAELHEKLLPGSVAFITGPSGVGKTALSLESVYALPAGRFPDGVLFHSFYGRPRVAECFEYIVRALDPAARIPSPELAAALLRGKRRLLLLDGAEEADDLPQLLTHRGDCVDDTGSGMRRKLGGTSSVSRTTVSRKPPNWSGQ